MMIKYLFTIILLLFTAGYISASQINSHDLTIDFTLQEHSFTIVDVMEIGHDGNGKIDLLINNDFSVDKIRINDKKAKFKEFPEYDWSGFQENFTGDDSVYFGRAKMLQIKLKSKFRKADKLKLEIRYSGVIYDTVSAASFSRVNIADQTIGTIGEKGVYLSPEAVYYPCMAEGMPRFSVTTRLPERWHSVTDGRLVSHRTNGGISETRWESPHPTDGLYISAGIYYIQKEECGDIDIYGFFFPEDSLLAKQYASACVDYIKLYEDLIGPYPYSKFAVVENFFPTGYGMPSWTLLGQRVVHLPWIVNISLGHEICHNWWGNSVFVDYEKGNWCEGLTTYCADYLYKERESESAAADYRTGQLKEYLDYVTPETDFPLTEFTGRTETYTRAIGYGKSAMVFHMLRKLIGDEDFWESLGDLYNRQIWQKTSWDDIQQVFEDNYGDDLEWFFNQWVKSTGAPELSIVNASLDKFQERYIVNLEIEQPLEPFILNVPITIHFNDTIETRWSEISPGVHKFAFAFDKKPEAAGVDINCDVFRELDRDELPPSLSEVLGSSSLVIANPSAGDTSVTAAYQSLASQLNRKGDAVVKFDTEITDEDIAQNSIIIMGKPGQNALFEKLLTMGVEWDKWAQLKRHDGGFSLMGRDFIGDDASIIIVLRNPLNPDNSIAVFAANSPEEIERTGVKLVHYGKYSYLAFQGGRNLLKGKWMVTENPMMRKF
ncbi:hypothetical protein ISS30_00830 [bacterium]|nr:hypothetical protein [FCB group bacterium]MBL7190216.1 hypothetical protein [bacterium]